MAFTQELQASSRIEANRPKPQAEEAEEDGKSQLAQSWIHVAGCPRVLRPGTGGLRI